MLEKERYNYVYSMFENDKVNENDKVSTYERAEN